MLMKAVGAIIVFFSCTAAGVFLSMKDKFRADDLREMKRGLMLLKSEISYASRPLYEAMIEISEKTENTISEIFEDSGRLLKSKSVTSVDEAWEKTLRDRRARTFFKSDDIDILTAFGKILGGSDKQCQLSNIDTVIDYIDMKSEELLKKNSKDSRLFKSAGVLSGILIVVVLF